MAPHDAAGCERRSAPPGGLAGQGGLLAEVRHVRSGPGLGPGPDKRAANLTSMHGSRGLLVFSGVRSPALCFSHGDNRWPKKKSPPVGRHLRRDPPTVPPGVRHPRHHSRGTPDERPVVKSGFHRGLTTDRLAMTCRRGTRTKVSSPDAHPCRRVPERPEIRKRPP